MLQDLRFTLRLLRHERWFSLAVIVALALGIGVNAAGFTIVDAALLRSLPFDDAERLVMLSWRNRSGRRTDVSYAEFVEWRTHARSFVGLAAFTDATLNLSDGRLLPEQARGAWVTANTFALLGQQPILGRDFTPSDDRAGAERAVIIGEGLWRRRYDSDTNVLGVPIRINGEPATIVGVMPASMKFPDHTEVWAPLIPTAAERARTDRRLSVFGRLSDQTTERAAQTDMNAVADRQIATYPNENKEFLGIRVESFTDNFVGGIVRTLFVIIMVAAGLVLLIACANVANLLLSRSAFRAREVALRMALGATRGRVVRQLLVESVVFGLIGGGLGLLFAMAGMQVFDAAMEHSGAPYWITFTLDYTVFAYVVAVCVVAALLAGLAPALHVSKASSNDVLKSGGRGTTGSRRVRRFSGALIVAELALTIALLGAGGLMARSFLKLYSVNLGFSTDGLMAMQLPLPESKYADPDARRAFVKQLEPRLAAVPGIEGFAVTTGVPPRDGGERLLEIDRATRRPEERPRFVSAVTVSPRFFDVLRVPILRGRGFEDADGSPGAETVVINERLASQFFPGEDPIGRRLRFVPRAAAAPVAAAPPESPWHTIVGIIPTIGQASPQDAYLNAVVYIPYRQESPGQLSLLVRSSLPPASIMTAVGREVQAIDRDQPLVAVRTLEQLLAEDRWLHRTFGSLFATFAVIALVLSALGLYAVVAYSVTERTQEIGVRMAVGAQRHQVSWLILRRGLLQLTIGLPLGLAGALGLGVALQRMLIEITPGDPATMAAVTILLTVVSLLACVFPARRAMRIDPMVALRTE